MQLSACTCEIKVCALCMLLFPHGRHVVRGVSGAARCARDTLAPHTPPPAPHRSRTAGCTAGVRGSALIVVVWCMNNITLRNIKVWIIIKRGCQQPSCLGGVFFQSSDKRSTRHPKRFHEINKRAGEATAHARAVKAAPEASPGPD